MAKEFVHHVHEIEIGPYLREILRYFGMAAVMIGASYLFMAYFNH